MPLDRDQLTGADLDRLRTIGDPPLDDLVRSSATELGGVPAIARLFHEIHNARGLTAGELARLRHDGLITDELVEFFAERNSVPPELWVDVNVMHAGGDFYRRRGLLGFVALAFASLPACYCWAVEADVLTTTGRLSTSAVIPRRIPETAQFVLDTVTRGAFDAGGIGIQAAHKVRLLHALIRYMLVVDPAAARADNDGNHLQPWDTASKGYPISQEFLTATLLTFHTIVIASMTKMGIRISDTDARAFLHRWNLTGYFLGLEEGVLQTLDSVAGTEQLLELIMQRNRRKTEHGARLQQTLLTYTKQNVIAGVGDGLLQPLTHVPAVLTRYLSGRATSDALSLELTWPERILYYPIIGVTRLVGFLDRFTAFQWLTRAVMRYAARHVWGLRSEGERVSMAEQPRTRNVILADELAKDWKFDKL